MADTGFSVGTFTGGGTFLVESLSGTYTPYGKLAWGGAGTVNKVGPTMALALPVGIYGGTLAAGTIDRVGTVQAGTLDMLKAGTLSAFTGTAAVAPVAGTTATRGTFVGTADTQLLAANANRTGAMFANDADQTLYLGLGGSAVGTASYSKQIPAGGFLSISGYTGEVRGLMGTTVGTGALRYTEVTK